LTKELRKTIRNKKKRGQFQIIIILIEKNHKLDLKDKIESNKNIDKKEKGKRKKKIKSKRNESRHIIYTN
jgi:hypothetical protein